MPTLRLVASSQPESARRYHRALSLLSPLFQDISLFASLEETGLHALTRDLACALAETSAGSRQRVVFPTEAASHASGPRLRKGPVWEVGLERDGDAVLVTVFRQGVHARVVQADRSVRLPVARQAVLDAIDAQTSESAIVDSSGVAPLDRGLALAREQLLAFQTGGSEASPTSQRIAIAPKSSRKSRLWIDATVQLRKHPRKLVTREVSRADLHALLFAGDVHATVGASERRLAGVHVFLVAEALVQLSHDLLDALEARKSGLRQINIGRVQCGAQLEESGEATLLLSQGDRELLSGWRLPALPVAEIALASSSFARALTRQVTMADRAQLDNLRLCALIESADDLRLRLSAGDERTSLLNGSPESYRAFAQSDTRPPPEAVPRTAPAGKLRFSESWRADVPGIDLRSLHLCGDHLLCASQREIACIERTTGQMLWSKRTHRGVSIPTPVGLVRLSPEGVLTMHDVADGERLYQLRLGPCSGARTSGAIVNAPGLPHLLLVGEGERQLSAVDLDSSEIRWRRAVRRDGALRLRRAGKLVIASSGEPELSAIDLLCGEVVWRLCEQGRFAHGVGIDNNHLFAVATSAAPGSRRGEATLSCVDTWTGALRWRAAAPRALAPLGAPLITRDLVVIVSDDGDDTAKKIGLCAFDRMTGALRYDLPGGLCDGHAARLLVDDVLIANSETGELVAFDIGLGRTRYRHVFAGARHSGDRPHGLQPVLRSGALFLPQSEVFVVRPSDGALIGRTGGDLVPDVLRVDERCGVYVAEASGYLAAYHALPMLTLVEPR
jgi:outer membrane protein assembly factor BamB